MFLNNRRAEGLRARLLATSMFATGLIAGAGGLDLAVSPGAAVAAGVCTPTANGQTGSGSATAASGEQTCAASDTGIAYTTATGIVVDLTDGASVTTDGVFITGTGAGSQVEFDVDTSTDAGGAITATGAGEDAIHLTSNGGDVIIGTGALGEAGSVVTGANFGVFAQTGGAGKIAISLTNNVTGKGNGAIWASTSGTGSIMVTAATSNGSGIAVNGSNKSTAIVASSSHGSSFIATGTGGVTDTADVTGAHGAIAAYAGAGTAEVINEGSTNAGILANGSGDVTGNFNDNANARITSTGVVTDIDSAYGLETITHNGTATISVNGGSVSSASVADGGFGIGIHAETNGSGAVTISTAAGTSVSGGGTGGIGIDVDSGSGSAANGANISVTTNGTVSGSTAVTISDSVAGTVTVTADAAVTGVTTGIFTETQNGLNTVNLGAASTVSASKGQAVEVEDFATGTGDLTVTTLAGSAIQGGTGGTQTDGLFVTTVNGSGEVNVTMGGTATTLDPTNGYGVRLNSVAGDINFTNTGAVLNGGLRATSSGGQPTLDIEANVTNTAASNSIGGSGQDGLAAVYARTTGNALIINVTGAATTISSTNGSGISMLSNQAETVNVAAGDTVKGGSGPGDAGVFANSTGVGLQLVNHGTVTDSGAGAGVWSNVGSLSTITNTGAISSTSGQAIKVSSGTLTVANSGQITGGGSSAIDLTGETGGSTIDQSAGTITGNILFGSGHADTLDFTGGAFAGNVTGQGLGSVDFDLGSGSFSYAGQINNVFGFNLNSGSLNLAQAALINCNAYTQAAGSTLTFQLTTNTNSFAKIMCSSVQMGGALIAQTSGGGFTAGSYTYAGAFTFALKTGAFASITTNLAGYTVALVADPSHPTTEEDIVLTQASPPPPPPPPPVSPPPPPPPPVSPPPPPPVSPPPPPPVSPPPPPPVSPPPPPPVSPPPPPPVSPPPPPPVSPPPPPPVSPPPPPPVSPPPPPPVSPPPPPPPPPVVAIGTGAIYGQNLALVTDSWPPLVIGAFAGGVADDGAGRRSGLWVKGYGLFSHEGDGEAAPGFNATAGGIIAGAQWAAGNGVTAGAAFSYARVDATFTSAEGVEEVTQFKGAAYARYEGGGMFLRGLVGISSDSFQTARMADPQTVAQGRFSGTGGAGFAEAGRSFAFGPGVTVTPSLRLGYVGARVGGFDETGAQGLDLAVSGASLDSFASTAGLRFEKTFTLGETSQMTGAVSLGWEHQFLQAAETLDAAYAGGPETPIGGNAVSRDGAVVSVKVNGVASGKVHYFLGYDVKVAGTYSDQTASAGLKFIF